MKNILLSIIVLFVAIAAKAQVPNFGTTAGDQKLYGYSSMKYRVNAEKNGMPDWQTYSTLQYGFTDYLNLGVDLYTGGANAYIGYVVRGGYKFSKYYSLGAQLTPSFSLGDNHKFGYLTSAIYMNGDITKDGRLFWVTDTWLENDKDKLTSAMQWTYLGYTCPLGKSGNNSITPMGGIIHSWKFDQNPDLSLGFYFTHKNINLYAWANDIVTNHPRFILAVEFKFSNK